MSMNRWLLEQVAPAYDAMHADPSRAIPAEQVFASLRVHHAERMKRTERES